MADVAQWDYQRSNRQREVWVAPDNTDPLATGSPWNPYNPNSAQYRGFTGGAAGGCIQQAINELSVPHNRTGEPWNTATEEQAAVVNLAGGVYPVEDIVCPRLGSLSFIQRSLSRFSNPPPGTSTISRIVDPVAFGSTKLPNLAFTGPEAGGFLGFFDLELTDDGQNQAQGLRIDGTGIIGAVRNQTPCVGSIAVYGDRSTVDGDFDLPTANVWEVESCVFNQEINVESLELAKNCYFDEVIVAQPPASSLTGIVGCTVLTSWTGPAFSALWDAATQTKSAAAVFAGGAGPMDYVDPRYYSVILGAYNLLPGATQNAWRGIAQWPGIVTNVQNLNDTPPAPAGTCVATVTRQATNLLAAPNIDLMAQPPGAVVSQALSATPADLVVAANDVFRIDAVSDNAGMAPGDPQFFQVTILRK